MDFNGNKIIYIVVAVAIVALAIILIFWCGSGQKISYFTPLNTNTMNNNLSVTNAQTLSQLLQQTNSYLQNFVQQIEQTLQNAPDKSGFTQLMKTFSSKLNVSISELNSTINILNHQSAITPDIFQQIEQVNHTIYLINNINKEVGNQEHVNYLTPPGIIPSPTPPEILPTPTDFYSLEGNLKTFEKQLGSDKDHIFTLVRQIRINSIALHTAGEKLKQLVTTINNRVSIMAGLLFRSVNSNLDSQQTRRIASLIQYVNNNISMINGYTNPVVGSQYKIKELPIPVLPPIGIEPVPIPPAPMPAPMPAPIRPAPIPPAPIRPAPIGLIPPAPIPLTPIRPAPLPPQPNPSPDCSSCRNFPREGYYMCEEFDDDSGSMQLCYRIDGKLVNIDKNAFKLEGQKFASMMQ